MYLYGPKQKKTQKESEYICGIRIGIGIFWLDQGPVPIPSSRVPFFSRDAFRVFIWAETEKKHEKKVNIFAEFGLG